MNRVTQNLTFFWLIVVPMIATIAGSAFTIGYVSAPLSAVSSGLVFAASSFGLTILTIIVALVLVGITSK